MVGKYNIKEIVNINKESKTTVRLLALIPIIKPSIQLR